MPLSNPVYLEKGITSLFPYHRRHRIAVAPDTLEECLGRTEIQIHVQANGKVVLIIGYEEGDDLLLLTFLVLYEREYQAAVNGVVIRLDLLLAAVINVCSSTLRPVAMGKSIFCPTL